MLALELLFKPTERFVGERLLRSQDPAGNSAVGEQLSSMSIHRLAKSKRLAGVGDWVQAIQPIQREQPNVPDLFLRKCPRSSFEIDFVFN
ncbi:hypothetical protein D3C81_1314420 [compost metagenome]